MTPRGEPDPRQLRMESLQAMSEAARRADAAGAPRPPPRGPRPPLRRVHGDVSTAPHIHGAYIPPAEAAEQPPRSLSVCSGHSGDGYRSPSTACRARWAAPSRATAWRGSASSRRLTHPHHPHVTTHPHHYSTTNVNLSMAAYEGWGQANQSSMIRTTGQGRGGGA